MVSDPNSLGALEMSQVNSAEGHKLESSFETVRRSLMQDEFRDRLDKPLAYWALPNDRRLPLAFLGRTLGDLLQTPYSSLSATRGIGQKKISSLLKLLHRAMSDSPPAVPFGLKALADELDASTNGEAHSGIGAMGFDASVVSEALWVQWCDTVKRHHLGHVRLGYLAPSLQSIPTVIWDAPLGNYLGRTLGEIRQMKTHGEKRVRVVLEVFHSIHELLYRTQNNSTLAISLTPRFVPAVEQFVATLASQTPITAPRQEVARHLAQPLLDQILVDCGEAVHALTRDRLGIDVPVKSVRDQSREMGVTRARVYQLLEDCGRVMAVRWPRGGHIIRQLPECSDRETQILLKSIAQLFFPEKAGREPIA